MHGAAKWGDVFRISLRQSEEIPFEIDATPTSLRLIAHAGQAEFIFAEPDLLQFRAVGVGVRLEMVTDRFDNAQPLDQSTWMVSSFSASTKFLLESQLGQLEVDAPWRQLECEKVVADFSCNEMERIEGTIREIADHVPIKKKAELFSSGLEQVSSDWEDWRSKTLGPDMRHAEAMNLAAYVNWSSIVAPRGFLKRPTMLMSKNLMSNVWSWDHCFNAMAHCKSHPVLAWNQFMIFFDHQAASGAIADCMGDTLAAWDFTKPPVHGWALSWMLARGMELTQSQLREAYLALSNFTEWWLRERDFDGDGRPEYYHGNDSGWDNGSVFKDGGPIESPDLISFLLLQMETLADLASRLKKEEEANAWLLRSQDLLERLLKGYWRKDRFIAYGPLDVEITDSKSLFLYLPLVLGRRLPAEIREVIINNLKSSGLITPHGLATEPPNSPLYESDGYWRGPIWAPSTLLIVDGLSQMGEIELAQEIAKKFCVLCSESGFAENFDAQSGAGLRDRGYTWTASVFLILARYYEV